jgi:hypothetical protein
MGREIDAIAEILERQWDPIRHLCRLAPGAVTGRGLRSLDLHPIRDSALGVVADFAQGRRSRANTTLREVLAHQYDAPGRPWHGTFRVTAQDRQPRWPDAQPWRDYDPNWRQFLGCILGYIALRYSEVLDADLRTGIDRALQLCVEGEPEQRIPDWYTNPNLMHAWLVGHVGRVTHDGSLLALAQTRREMIMNRFHTYGDVDEYNSPTYDGVDLMAAMLWMAYPPSEEFASDGESLCAILMKRIATLFHPDLGVTCGPYSRTYGLWLDEYVSLTGVALRVLGATGTVLPRDLNVETDHVHDLYFLPIISDLAAQLPQIIFHPLHTERIHQQEFGDVVATSVIGERHCVGWENGRQVSFARDQYVPAVVHRHDGDGARGAVAVMLGRSALDVWSELTAPSRLAVKLRATTPGEDAQFRLVTSPQSAGIRIEMNQAAVNSVISIQGALQVQTLAFDVPEVELHITWD